MMLNARFELDLVDTLYLASILGDQPRSIDRHIDYFGSGPRSLEPRNRDSRACHPSHVVAGHHREGR